MNRDRIVTTVVVRLELLEQLLEFLTEDDVWMSEEDIQELTAGIRHSLSPWT